MAEVRMFLDRTERYIASLSEADRQTAAVAQALGELARAPMMPVLAIWNLPVTPTSLRLARA